MNLGMRNRLSGSASLLLMSKVGLVFPSTVHKTKRRKSKSATQRILDPVGIEGSQSALLINDPLLKKRIIFTKIVGRLIYKT
jgi:hypothetical protein